MDEHGWISIEMKSFWCEIRGYHGFFLHKGITHWSCQQHMDLWNISAKIFNLEGFRDCNGQWWVMCLIIWYLSIYIYIHMHLSIDIYVYMHLYYIYMCVLYIHVLYIYYIIYILYYIYIYIYIILYICIYYIIYMYILLSIAYQFYGCQDKNRSAASVVINLFHSSWLGIMDVHPQIVSAIDP